MTKFSNARAAKLTEQMIEDRADETRDQFICRLEKSYEASGRRNNAIGNHLTKVRSMNEEQFKIHKAKLDENMREVALSIAQLTRRATRGRR